MDEILALLKRIEEYGCSCDVLHGFACSIHSLCAAMRNELINNCDYVKKL